MTSPSSLFAPSGRDSLDVLLDEAMAAQQARRMKALRESPRVTVPGTKPPSLHETFANPENWKLGKVVAIIHRDALGVHTLIGAFREYLHRSTSARKLSRLEEPAAVDHEEFVAGPTWLGVVAIIQPPRIEEPEILQDREIVFDLELSSIQVTARDALIRVRLERGWIRGVSLVYTTQFVCPANRHFIQLPKRLDILEAMSFENKVALKKKLGLGG